MLDAETIRRRLRAARALHDITVEQLGERLKAERLGAKTLGNIERGDRAVRPMELRAIASALNLPYEFFTVDSFDGLANQSTDLARLEAKIDRVLAAVDEPASPPSEQIIEDTLRELGMGAFLDHWKSLPDDGEEERSSAA